MPRVLRTASRLFKKKKPKTGLVGRVKSAFTKKKPSRLARAKAHVGRHRGKYAAGAGALAGYSLAPKRKKRRRA